MSRTRALSIARWSLLALLFAVGAVASTWPRAEVWGSGLPLGTERVATVPLFNLWTLAWNVEAISHGFEGYWQAPIFHPARDAFAFSEPQPVLGLLAFVLSRLGLSMVEIYGLLLLAALALNGLLAAVLLRRVRLGWLASITGGALVLLLPFSHQELGVLQLVPLAGVLAFALAVRRFAGSPGTAAGLALGASLALAYGLAAQVAVFCALAATPAAAWLFWPHRGLRRAWLGLAAGAALFFVLVSPLLLAQMRATSGEDFVRSAETVRKQSARPEHYAVSPWPQRVPAPGVETATRPSARAFWPGTLRVLLALLAAGIAWTSARWRRQATAGLLVLAASVILSFGGHLSIAGLSLVEVWRPLPGLGQIRSFFRFALFAQLAVAALAAGSLHWLQEIVRERLTTASRSLKIGGEVLLVAVALLAILEMPPTPGPIEKLPPIDLELPWLSFLEAETTANDVLAFLPFPTGRGAGDYLGTAQWMFWQQRHWRPMVNGYSGFFPRRFKALKKAMADFPSAPTLDALHAAGVRYCIVPRAVIEASPPPDPDGRVTLERVFRDEKHELAIFELRR